MLAILDFKRYLEVGLGQIHAVFGYIVHVVDLDATQVGRQLRIAYDAFMAAICEHAYGAHEREQTAYGTANVFGPF